MFKLLLDVADHMLFLGVNAEGANAATEVRVAKEMISFILSMLF